MAVNTPPSVIDYRHSRARHSGTLIAAGILLILGAGVALFWILVRIVAFQGEGMRSALLGVKINPLWLLLEDGLIAGLLSVLLLVGGILLTMSRAWGVQLAAMTCGPVLVGGMAGLTQYVVKLLDNRSPISPELEALFLEIGLRVVVCVLLPVTVFILISAPGAREVISRNGGSRVSLSRNALFAILTCFALSYVMPHTLARPIDVLFVRFFEGTSYILLCVGQCLFWLAIAVLSARHWSGLALAFAGVALLYFSDIGLAFSGGVSEVASNQLPTANSFKYTMSFADRPDNPWYYAFWSMAWPLVILAVLLIASWRRYAGSDSDATEHAGAAPLGA